MQPEPMRAGQVQLYTTGLTPEGLRLTGVEPVPSVDEAIAGSIARHGDPSVAVIPVVPRRLCQSLDRNVATGTRRRHLRP